MSKFYITTPIYYVNDKPHIGHAYTTIAADVLARFKKMESRDIFFLTGTDEHGAKIAEAAKRAELLPQIFCDEIVVKFKDLWKKLEIDYSYFIRTTDPNHIEKVTEFLEKLKKNNFLYEDEYQGLYCVGCEKFLTEKDLVDGKCPDHNREPELIKEKNWFFNLKEFLPKIQKLVYEDKILIQPANAKREVLGLFKQGLDNFSISRQKVAWGIPLPWDKKQTIYVWVEALLNYLTAAQGEKNGFWPPDAQLMSHDILKFHAIYWPAILLSYGVSESELPRKIFVHGYFTLNGQKMSKSIGNVIDPNTLIEKYGADATRYLLLNQFPFGQDGDICEEKLTEMYNADLANGIGNLVSRVARFQLRINRLRIANCELKEYKSLVEELKFYDALKLIMDKVKECNDMIEEKKPWRIKDRQEIEETLMPVVEKILIIAEMLKPFMPKTSDKILEILKTGKSEILFPRI